MPITIYEEKCVRCGICMDECPVGAICYKEGNIPHLIEEDCNDCGSCISVCITEAIAP
jgi:NAD-dependent dihydropyrimidine dehydrogenase PreA subunit